MAITRLLIANRGEIAVRIIRAARELGLKTVQAHSAADSDSLAVRMADAAVLIGPPMASKSYLNIANILKAAADSGADAVHPGYGFLAENADFADAVQAAGLAWIGPDGDAIRVMGDKVAARVAAEAAGVPVVPGSEGRIDDPERARAVALAIGFPVMIKAAAGGGGRGIRIAHDMAEFDRLLPQASAEARSAFGDGGLYLEKVIERARHIEVQILGDGTRAIHLYDRECSLQRRRQKVWEEAPSARLPPAMRARMCASAVALAQAVGYRGAGTVEYLYDDAGGDGAGGDGAGGDGAGGDGAGGDGAGGHFYFLEMNTRIQVEHPVTEMVTGIDLVREQIRVCAGEPLRHAQDDIRLSGHAIEVRINAEDPAKAFQPGPGTVTDLGIPGGGGVRFDTMLYPGYAVPPFYDSLLGKLIVWDEDRAAAITRLRGALAELRIGGLPTTRALHQLLARDPEVQAGEFHTRWLEPWLERNAHRLGTEETEA